MPAPIKPRHISVIITTYNSPDALRLTLKAFDLQTRRDFELVVADDGSGADTATVIDEFRAESDLPLIHVWHEDRGFRKCEILNRAIESATGDYLIFTDGDCIPRPDFVSVHHNEAEPRRFLSGTYNNLPPSFAEIITESTVGSGEAFQLKWLRSHGLPRSRKALRLTPYKTLAGILNRLTTTHPTWNGCNASGWKSDLEAVNGFDERMRYGGLDRELGLRLNNAGIKGKQIRFKAICLHIDHDRGYMNEKDLQDNLAIREATLRERSTFTPYGIRKAA
ncbi:glycosyltransferase family 2 protein [Candidatus Laterigemmans baculatus]|uniref:glycosyltransferase family 2 protein n=1 Tax=Candidatus Laterigemmans baculatus TaxID=2770505 RepID=UPI0013DCD0BD|nr:glycosyltransferase family 2 protein [Candidatus Laterigemmans baculatus]